MIITPYEIAYLRLSTVLHITECLPLVGPVEFLLPVDSSPPWAGDQCRLMTVEGGTVWAGGIDSDSEFVRRNPFLDCDEDQPLFYSIYTAFNSTSRKDIS